MKEYLKMIRKKVMANIIIIMEKDMKENSRMDFQKVEEYIIIIMEKDLLVIIKMMQGMVMESIFI